MDNNNFNPPLQAVYKYKRFMYDKGISMPYNVKCVVIRESKTQYQIRLSVDCDGKYVKGQEIWVKKSNVILVDKPSQPDYTDAWWHN